MSQNTSPITRFSHLIPPLLGVTLFGVSIWAISQELQEYSVRQLLNSLAAIPRQYLLLAIGLTVLNYVMLTGYDTLATLYVRHPLPYRRTALVAVVSYAVSNSVGFALLSGSAIRYRFYIPWGFSPLKIAHIIAFCNLSFWLGLFAVGGFVFLLQPVEVPTLLHLPFVSVRPIGVLFLAVITAYLSWNILSQKPIKIGSWVLPHLPVKLCLAQIAVTSLDWALAAAIFYALLPSGTAISFPGFFGIYLLAQIAGIISNVPGGLGVFETVMLLLLSSSVPTTILFGALLAYRCIYYFLPLFIAALLLGAYELRQRWK